ncbi:Six-hairpin glycosidase-like protein [Sordaria brevicollis]|uniref:Glucoamylase n=1 Tax=Sordaria brevicollis TaxID=83679 RepID=A0AAE0PET3_SORBR|nr:Six-hairpin glycosidase-like protein [Sordaria brevicollis]
MVHLTQAVFAGLVAWPTVISAAATDKKPWPQGVSLKSFIGTESKIALDGVLANIGPNGARVPGAGAGIVIASPTKENPNYFYTWTRDAALTYKTLVDEFLFGNKALQPYIEDYIHSQAVLQTVTNPSGKLLPSGAGLGEPKFNADGSRYNGNWGRPQRDGPALRAIALIEYANYLVKKGEKQRVREVIWPVIANDLNYAPQILCFLNSAFWSPTSSVGGGHLLGNINIGSPRSGIDANTILGPLAAFDINAPCDSPTFQPCHPKVLSTFKVLVDTFRNPSLYPINSGIPKSKGVALGRYPEDIYYTGNPWYLITLGAAELLYNAVARWEKQGYVSVDKTSEAFFKTIYPLARAGQTYRAWPLLNSLSPFSAILRAVENYADSFVGVVQKYTPSSGSLAEQFLKTAPGTPTSADNLTWSFAAFLSMNHRRERQVPTSWVPKSVSLPAQCEGTSFKGTYAPATGAGAPELNVTCQSTILFQVNASTYYGENIYLTGNSPDLGNWDLSQAIPMQSTNYTQERPLWFAKVPLTAGQNVEYAFVREQDCGQAWIWEDQTQANRTVSVPACVEGEEETVRGETDDAFRGKGGSSGGC